ncbi:hypothetical protein GDO78_010313 [Eleutherodactylus coqui]|uniref:Secreted protein n=1 Tax=Eleutherodactylus coqui TaxID=57060 RepID=A0A8J6F592_ELECQ|nr:hypothetical protein GDO78_010313 [Eleutherodactylus coqui]
MNDYNALLRSLCIQLFILIPIHSTTTTYNVHLQSHMSTRKVPSQCNLTYTQQPKKKRMKKNIQIIITQSLTPSHSLKATLQFLDKILCNYLFWSQGTILARSQRLL